MAGWLGAASVVAPVLAFLAGWLYARITPDWRIDRFNERVPDSRGCDFDDSDPAGMYGGSSSGLAAGGSFLSIGCSGVSLGSGLALLAALILGAYSWPAGKYWWMVIISVVLGYGASRLSYREPAGPAEPME